MTRQLFVQFSIFGQSKIAPVKWDKIHARGPMSPDLRLVMAWRGFSGKKRDIFLLCWSIKKGHFEIFGSQKNRLPTLR